MNVSLAWWNTSLSPTRRPDRATDEDIEIAASLLGILATDLHHSFIALGEVSEKDIASLDRVCDLTGYRILNAMHKAGRSRFDICVLYRPEVLQHRETQAITQGRGGEVDKLAQRISFDVTNEERTLHIFISHWPSRLHMDQHDPKRFSFGVQLRTAVNNLLEKDPGALVVMLGDYNDEPFDVAIAEHLMATRDRDLVKAKPHLFYNPFWRHMSQFEDSGGLYKRGSYFHRGNAMARWRTFDQMLFSSSFILDGQQWSLDEQSTSILDIPAYTELVVSGKRGFDHLPIVGKLKRSQIDD